MKLSAVMSIPTQMRSDLLNYLPTRVKRMFFFSTLLTRLTGEKRADLETISKMNQLMSLASHEGAVMATTSLTKLVWHRKTPQEILQLDFKNVPLNDENLHRMAASALEQAPQWCRYGPLATVAEDMRKFFENRQTLLGY